MLDNVHEDSNEDHRLPLCPAKNIHALPPSAPTQLVAIIFTFAPAAPGSTTNPPPTTTWGRFCIHCCRGDSCVFARSLRH